MIIWTKPEQERAPTLNIGAGPPKERDRVRRDRQPHKYRRSADTYAAAKVGYDFSNAVSAFQAPHNYRSASQGGRRWAPRSDGRRINRQYSLYHPYIPLPRRGNHPAFVF